MRKFFFTCLVVFLGVTMGFEHRASIQYHDGSTVQTLRVATISHVDSGNSYAPRLKVPLSIGRHCFRNGTTFGASEISLGQLTLLNLDGGLDSLEPHGFDGRTVTVETRETGGTWHVSWTGVAEAVDWGDQVIVKLRDRSQVLDKALQQLAYTTDDVGINEQDDLPGRKRPVAAGTVHNAEPVLLDWTLGLYELNGGNPVESISAVYDGGLELGQNILKNGNFENGDEFWAHADVNDGVCNVEYRMIEPGYWVYQKFTEGLEKGVSYIFSLNVVGKEIPTAKISISYAYFSEITFSFGTHVLIVPTQTLSDGTNTFTFTVPVDAIDSDKNYLTLITTSGDYYVDDISLASAPTDHATRAALEAATVPHGGYHTCLAEGLIRVGTLPTSTLTVDFEVDSAVSTVPAIVSTLLLSHAGMLEADIDTDAFDALAALNGSQASFYDRDGSYTVREALDLLFGSVGAWYGFDRSQGKLTCGRVQIPTSAAVTIDLDRQALGDVSLPPWGDEGRGIPYWRYVLTGERNWRVIGTPGEAANQYAVPVDGLQGEVTPERAAWFAQESRLFAAEATAVQTKHLLAKEVQAESVLEENVLTEAQRRLAFYGGSLVTGGTGKRKMFEFTVPLEILWSNTTGPLVDIGSGIEIVSTRHGLASGAIGMVIGMDELYPGVNDEGVQELETVKLTVIV